MKPLLLDLFCGEGGAAAGYAAAGFDVVGVDTNPRVGRRYPFEFRHTDAIEYLTANGHQFDAIHASPPCQAYSLATKLRDASKHPRLIEATRAALVSTGKPYVIENVPGAPLNDPITLCGSMFGLRTYRHRLFESNVALAAPPHPEHRAPLAKMGRPVQPGEFMHVVGNFSGVQMGRDVMAMPWASRDGLREAIPPAYTAHIAAQLIEAEVSA